MSALNFKQFFHIWTQQLLNWLTSKFDSITIDTSDLAKEINATSNKQAVLSAIEQAKIALQGNDQTATLAALKTAMAIDVSDLAKEVNATTNKIAVLNAIDAAKISLQGGDTTATLSALKTAIANIDIDTSTIVKQGTNVSATLTTTQAAVVDGNDTSVSVAKDIRSEVGTGSDTASESGTLFAVVKWVKDRIKSIGTDYAKQGNNINASISDIQTLIGYTIEEIDKI